MMNILVTGSAGFVGRNLVENLKNIRDGKNRSRPEIRIEEIYEYDHHNTVEVVRKGGFCIPSCWSKQTTRSKRI